MDEAISRLSCLPDMELEPCQHDVHEKETITQFMRTGCRCLKWNGKQCSLQFTSEYVESIRADCQELSHDELDLPDVPRPMSTAGTPEPTSHQSELSTKLLSYSTCTEEFQPPHCKRKRKCGICRLEGHNNRSCPEKENFDLQRRLF